MPNPKNGHSKIEAVIKTSLKNAFVKKLKGKTQKDGITQLIQKFVRG